MPKGKKEDDVELDFGSDDDRQFSGSDADPVDAATGESLFDDLNPRFTRQLDAAAEKAKGKPSQPKTQDPDEDDLDPADEELDDLDEPVRRERDEVDEDTDEDNADESEQDLEASADEDADEPRHGNPKVLKRLARADRLLEESRAQIAELQRRDNEREAQAKLTASTAEFNTFKTQTSTKLEDLKAKKIKALDDGDTAAIVDIDEEIIELKAELRSREREHEEAKRTLEESSKRKTASPITIVKVAQWKRKNKRYETDPEFAAVVNGIDAQLVQGGSNPETDEHYRELDRRLKKLFPPKTPAPRRRHPSQQMEREESPAVRRPAGDARVAVKNGKIKISPAKLARVKQNMQRFGLDPSNKKDLQDYILNNPGL